MRLELSPSQSRLAASLAASLTPLPLLLPLLLALLLLSSSPCFALALADELSAVEHRIPSIGIEYPEALLAKFDDDEDEYEERTYEPGFALFDRDITGRAAVGVAALVNNVPQTLNLVPGTSACYVFEKSAIFTHSVRRRDDDDDDDDDDDGRNGASPSPSPSPSPSGSAGPNTNTKTVYLSATTCLQPNRVSPPSKDAKGQAHPGPPQLKMYVSSSTEPGCAAPPKNASVLLMQSFDRGAAMLSVEAAGDVFITVSAPAAPDGFEGIYNFQVAASVDDHYHHYDAAPGALLWMDSDSSAALLMTRNLTSDAASVGEIMARGPQFELYVVEDAPSPVQDLLHSMCGLKNTVAIASKRLDDGAFNNNDMARTKMTAIGPGSWPKQQFYLDGLNSSTSYVGILYRPGGSGGAATSFWERERERERQAGGGADANVAGGGGTVFAGTDFQTSAGTNCRVITDLDFCDEVQWAAPGNNRLNNSELAKAYDDYARDMYSNFEKAMMQIPCEAPSTQQYSLVRTCDDCRVAYKRWLCTVSIPRCEDFSKENNFTVVRNAGQPFPNGSALAAELARSLEAVPAFNASRNVFIDQEIAPGPYKEILPCADVCYEVVQSCPAAIGFACPLPKMVSFNVSYGRRQGGDDDVVRCNYPGEPRTKISAAVGGPQVQHHVFIVLGSVSFTLAMLLF